MGNNHFRNYGNGGQQSQNDRNISTPDYSAIINDYKSSWITNGTDDELIDFAQKVGKSLVEGKMTSSQLRGFYGEIKRIQSAGFEKEKPSFFLLRPKIAYALARSTKNNTKNKGLSLLNDLFHRCYKDVKDKRTYDYFCNFFEAIVAYHKAFEVEEQINLRK